MSNKSGEHPADVPDRPEPNHSTRWERQARVRGRAEVAAYGLAFGGASPLRARLETLTSELISANDECIQLRQRLAETEAELARKQVYLAEAASELEFKQGYLTAIEIESNRVRAEMQAALASALDELDLKQSYLEGAARELDLKQSQLERLTEENQELVRIARARWAGRIRSQFKKATGAQNSSIED